MSENYNTATEKPDLDHRVRDAIVNAIESGFGQYGMPWAVRQERGFSPITVGSVSVAA
jgi:hypothetical protein